MSTTKSILKSTFIYSIGTFGSKILLFALLPLYSFYLTKEELGEYDLILTIVTLFVPIITFQLSDGIYRKLLDFDIESNKRKISYLISSALFYTILGFFFFFLLSLIYLYFKDYQYYTYYLLFQLSSCFFPFFQQCIRGLKKTKLYSFIGISNAILTLFFSIIFIVILDWKIEGILLAGFIAQTISIFISFFKGNLIEYISIRRVRHSLFKSLFDYSFPLVPNSISWWIVNASNRFLILFFLSKEFNGIYAISARFPAIVLMINAIFMLSWQDFTIGLGTRQKDDNNSQQYASKVFNSYVIFSLTLVIILTSISKYLMMFTVDKAYFDAWKYMPILFLSASVASFCAFLGAFFLQQKDTKGVFFTTIVGGFFNLSLTFVLINYIQLFAPAIGTLFGYIIILLLRIYRLKKTITFSVDKAKIMQLSLILILVFSSLFILKNHFYSLLIIVFSAIIFYLHNKNLFRILISKFKL